MHPNHTLLEQFYTAFQNRDADAMGACYANSARFSDPVFRDLSADEARAMWRMLIERGKDLRLTFDSVVANDKHGSAHWEATYTFQATGQLVTNSIQASFEFRDGLIERHVDAFPLYKWSRMALGAKGTLLGWTPLVQGKIRSMADRQLRKYLAKADA
ncbi:MAG: nuclear transport factor 2 family protein [Planctomycetota bacterium]